MACNGDCKGCKCKDNTTELDPTKPPSDEELRAVLHWLDSLPDDEEL